MATTRTHFHRIPVRLVKQKIAIGEALLEERNRRANLTGPLPGPSVQIPAAHSEVSMKEGPMKEEDLTQSTRRPSSASWQKFYREALLELDKENLKIRVAKAESAMRERLQEIAPTGEPVELREIEDAIATLRALRRTELPG